LGFGEKEGAIGYLVGEPNRGLEYMFIMMNTARLAVGLEGYAVAERAFQQAAEWARTRVQGRPPVATSPAPATIIHHPDVKRMMLGMKSGVEAMRALTLYAACQLDLARYADDAKVRAAAQARGDLLIPIVKGWCTEFGIEIASVGIQVHGGMGYIEETGAAQYLRDVRITAIYEGTTGIQSNDLIGRKIGRDRGAAMQSLIAEMLSELEAIAANEPVMQEIRTQTRELIGLLREATDAIAALYSNAPEQAAAVSVPYLKLCGTAIGGWLMARAASIAAKKLDGADREFYAGKLASARFYAAQILPGVLALHRTVCCGFASVVEADGSLI
jgi:hypothetical protein